MEEQEASREAAAEPQQHQFKAPQPRRPAPPPPRFAAEPEEQGSEPAAPSGAPEAGNGNGQPPSSSSSMPPPAAPPPKFAAPPPRDAGRDAAKAAAVAAARAAQHATPAQRERMVMEAAANVRVQCAGWVWANVREPLSCHRRSSAPAVGCRCWPQLTTAVHALAPPAGPGSQAGADGA